MHAECVTFVICSKTQLQTVYRYWRLHRCAGCCAMFSSDWSNPGQFGALSLLNELRDAFVGWMFSLHSRIWADFVDAAINVFIQSCLWVQKPLCLVCRDWMILCTTETKLGNIIKILLSYLPRSERFSIFAESSLFMMSAIMFLYPIMSLITLVG